MTYTIVDTATITAGRGPHPATSAYDKLVSESLGVSAFAVYQVELPPGAETVPHTHVEDRNEDVYAIVSGHGWLVVDDEPIAVSPGQFASVGLESTRFLRAGADGMIAIAVCAQALTAT